LSESNVADHSSRHIKGFLAKRNRRSRGKVSLLSAPGNVLVKTTLTKSLAEGLWYTQTEFLSKQGLTNSHWQTERCSDYPSSWNLYTSKVI